MIRDRATAVTANPITIAVKTSACGTGSTIRSIAVSKPSEKIGAVPPFIYPIAISKSLKW